MDRDLGRQDLEHEDLEHEDLEHEDLEHDDLGHRAVELVARLRRAGVSLAVAESLTGGLLCSTLVGVPGVSETLRGGVVAYATAIKRDLLGVDADLLFRRGPVDPRVALQMAEGVRARLAAGWGVATTGVAGPGPADGAPAGRVFVAVAGPATAVVRRLDLPGERWAVRTGTVAAALRLLAETVPDPGTGTPGPVVPF